MKSIFSSKNLLEVVDKKQIRLLITLALIILLLFQQISKFLLYIKNLMYFGYNSRGEIIRVANDTDNIDGSQDCKQIYMKDFNHVKERDVLHIVITPFNIDVYKEKKVTTGHTFLDIKNDEELHVYFTYDKNNVNMCVRDAVDIANHCGTKVYYYDVVYHY